MAIRYYCKKLLRRSICARHFFFGNSYVLIVTLFYDRIHGYNPIFSCLRESFYFCFCALNDLKIAGNIHAYKLNLSFF